MAIVFALGGGVVAAVIGGIATSEYDDYHRYSDYSNYSDAAEREKQRKEKREKEIAAAKKELESYQEYQIKPFLAENNLSITKFENGEELQQHVANLLKGKEQSEVNQSNQSLEEEIQQIDQLIKKIDGVIEENS